MKERGRQGEGREIERGNRRGNEKEREIKGARECVDNEESGRARV